jgi:hypothetical protein
VAGSRDFDRSKFKELVLHLAQASAGDEGFGMVKLNKLLYRADFEAFRLLGRSITGATYERQDYGPVARELPLALDELAAAGYLVWRHVPRGPYTRDVPKAVEPADTGLFSDDEKAIIASSLEDLATLGGKAASRWSHEQSSGWQARDNGNEIPYASAFVSTEPLSDEQMERALQRSRDEDWSSIRP